MFFTAITPTSSDFSIKDFFKGIRILKEYHNFDIQIRKYTGSDKKYDRWVFKLKRNYMEFLFIISISNLESDILYSIIYLRGIFDTIKNYDSNTEYNYLKYLEGKLK